MTHGPRIVLIIQARMGSRRLKGKVLMPIAGRPMLAHVLERAMRIEGLTDLVLTSPRTSDDRQLGVIASQYGYGFWPDDHSDLLGCFVRAARDRRADVVVRVTADCPLLDPAGSTAVLQHLLAGRFDYVSNDNILNTGAATDGYDTEAVTMRALEEADRDCSDVIQRHHVTAFIRENTMRFKVAGIVPKETPDRLKLSVDTSEDLARVRAIMEQGAL